MAFEVAYMKVSSGHRSLLVTPVDSPKPDVPKTAPSQARSPVDQFVHQPVGGTGALGLNDPNVAPARVVASRVQNQIVNWSDPAATLNYLSQIDSDGGRFQGGNDAVRCGAANLVAGSVLLGRTQFRRGLRAAEQRAEWLIDNFRAIVRDNPQMANDLRRAYVEPMEQALATLRELRRRDPSTLTYGDLHRLQEAVYTLAIIDQRTDAQGSYHGELEPTDHGYLTTGTLQTWRDLLWGVGNRPQMNGRRLDIFWVSNENNGGHFVLADERPAADGSRAIAFNPWPDADGTAYSRAVDGAGARVVPLSERAVPGRALRGVDIDTIGGRLPRRLPTH